VSAPPVPAPYDVCGDLPTGTTLLEASAGTGKTFTIAALATRLVAEGNCELPQLMLVTFSRAATQELRQRVRERFATTHRALGEPEQARVNRDDDLVRLLADATDDEVAARRRLLGRALSAFDAATIATTHGFCLQMLAGLGVVADHDRDLTFVERIDDLVTEVAGDLYLRKFAPLGSPDPLIDFRCATAVARAAAVTDRHAALAPAEVDPDSATQLRVGFATKVREETQARKRARRLYDWDDLLTRLRDTLAGEVTGPLARARLRARYRYVLVDEFQDTDPVQWDILRLAFHGATTMVLIGDPKQAIYGFRGADVEAYLDASDAASFHHTLARNWRSDPDLLRGLDAVFDHAALGDHRIRVWPVEPGCDRARLADAPVTAPVRLRVVPRAAVATAPGLPPVDAIREHVAADLAADVVRLLRSGAVLSIEASARPVRPGDIAVLVRSNRNGALVRDHLVAAGVPAVLTGAQSVFASPQAREWLVLLRALEQPHRSGLVRAAALTSFIGYDAVQLADPGADIDALALRLRGWREVLVTRGVAALLEVASSRVDLPGRALGRVDGERVLTDIRHIGQALHEAAVSEQLGPAALIEWLQRRIADAEDDKTEERSRRLETDAEAVQVVTIHASKGLQFPVVYLPSAWDRWDNTSPEMLQLHEGGIRILDVGGPTGSGYAERLQQHLAEDAAEELRLFYVAATRAQCQVVMWWAASRNTATSALHRVLFGGRDFDGLPQVSVTLPDDAKALDLLRGLAERAGDGCLAIEVADHAGEPPWTPPAVPAAALSAATFGRGLDLGWRRTSYSALTAAAHDTTARADVASEPEADERRDEPAVPGEVASVADEADDAGLREVASPMAALPTGAAFGTDVHAVLEDLDTAADDLAAELQRGCDDVLAARLTTSFTAADLAAALLPSLCTPLGPLAGGAALADISPADRLTELDFELPLLGGDAPRDGARATVREIAALLRHHLSAGDPLAAYPAALDELADQQLRGYLAGSIDAVLRIRDGAIPRYLVVDYKTNWLGGYVAGEAQPLTAWDYRPEAMVAAMIEAHYPLQAMLYCAALHRYLRWRQAGYDPATHLGGVLYLFLRGMCGPDTPVCAGAPTGVFAWQPSAGLVTDLSDLLDRGSQ
jgi:exodeoxyribonuclease V beta subunit